MCYRIIITIIMSANVLLTESLGVELHSDPWPEDVTLYQTFNVSNSKLLSQGGYRVNN